ncbi:hypothetical protein NM688_g1855 [Phlebia brevispora]|uniref:Uncharacterized protein n=1 Tax=Phlebia brevispora TaxID=194682 RepID=A0ACC1TA97_9APHY|nr:hypothetical protein NM688_g1855 [Phlebia brevispora]
MYNDGYKNIVNVDYSAILIEKMRNKYADKSEMQWHEMDVRELKFDSASFDVAIDKGTMDAMMTAKGDVWDPPQEVVQNCTQEVDEVLRVLRKESLFLYLTFGQPHFRRRYLTRPETKLEIRELGDAFHYYFYIRTVFQKKLMRDGTGFGAWATATSYIALHHLAVVWYNTCYTPTMHPALLIDEVFQVILEHCADWPAGDYRFMLCQLARCCRAWQDPVTDRLWRRLESSEPLLRLVSLGAETATDPCPSSEARAESLLSFNQYAAKIKHITFNVAAPELNTVSGVLLPNLTSAVLAREGCLSPAKWISSDKLKELEIDMRTASDSKSIRQRADSVALVLFQHPLQVHLRKLKIRGWMTPVLERAVMSLSSLRNLILHTGKSLSAQTFALLSSFPHLEQLNVHASHIDSDDFVAALPSCTAPFPALESLRIRGQRSLFCAVLDAIPRGNLSFLYLETEEPEQGFIAWRETFDLLVAKASDTLIEFTLDQILEPEEMEDSLAQAESDTRLAIETLRPLSGPAHASPVHDRRDDTPRLHEQRYRPHRFLVAATRAAQSRHASRHAGTCPAVDPPKSPIAALTTLAKRCPHLQSLTLPLDISVAPCDSTSDKEKDECPQPQQNALRKLYVGHAGVSDCIPAFLRSVLRIYPKLRDLECITMEKSVSFDAQASLQEHELPEDRRAGTADESADGQ